MADVPALATLRFFRREVWPQRKLMGLGWWIGCVSVWIVIVITGWVTELFDKFRNRR